MPTQFEIDQRREVDRIRAELKSSETPEMVYDLGENIFEENAEQSTGKELMNEMNGHSGSPQLNHEQVAQAEAVMAAMAPTMKAAIGVLIRGLMFSFPGAPPHVVLTAACFEVGNFAGQALQGDLSAMINLRKAYTEAFAEGVRKAPIMSPPAPGSMPTNLRGDA